MKLVVNYILKVHTTLNESLSGVSTILFYCHLHSPLHIAFYCYKHQALTAQMFLFLTGYQLFLKETANYCMLFSIHTCMQGWRKVVNLGWAK